MRILHVTADFPDPLIGAKTRCVANLLDLAPEREHLVYSLNRVDWRRGVDAVAFGDDWRAVTYGAPPYGLALRRNLDRLADFLIDDAQRRNLRPDVVHAHKISVEGPVAARVAAAFGVPYILSSMGDTDLKIIGFKRGLRPMWTEVWRGAAAALPSAPWTVTGLEALLGPRGGPVEALALPTKQDAIQAPRLVGPVIRSTFHLASWRRKNAVALIGAAARAARTIPDLRLDIVGGGDAEGFAALSAAVRRHGGGAVRLLGPRPHGEMGAFLNDSGGFALASKRETYGMVYAEALLGGTPILHSRGNGVDGYLPEGAVSVAVDHRDEASIADGLTRLARDEAAMKARLAEMQASGALDFLRGAAIGAHYRAVLDRVAASAAPAAVA